MVNNNRCYILRSSTQNRECRMHKKFYGVIVIIGIFWSAQASAVILRHRGAAATGICTTNLKCSLIDFKNPNLTGLKTGGKHQISSALFSEENPDGRGSFNRQSVASWLLASDSGFTLPRSPASISELLLQLATYLGACPRIERTNDLQNN